MRRFLWKLQKRVRAAVWAWEHVDDLTMLKWELGTRSLHKNSHGRDTAESYVCGWLRSRFLGSLPIE